MAELAPSTQQQHKKRGALHKLGKMLRGGKPAPPAAAGAIAAPRQRKPDPAALTAPLEHSMRAREAAALQAQLLSEQLGMPVAAEQHQEPQPAAVPPAIRQHVQQQQYVQQQQQQYAAQQQYVQQQQRYAAAEAEEELQPQGWPGDPVWAEQWGQQPLRASPLQSPVAAGRGPLQQVQQQQAQVRPGSGLSCPASPDRQYAYPADAAAGYAAGLAEAQAEGLGVVGGAAAAAGGPPRQESWDLRRLHVVHSNQLYQGPDMF